MIGLPDAANLALDDETWEQACHAAEERWVDDEHLLNAQRILAQAGRWDGVYVLSVIAGLETSVLIDADDKVFIGLGHGWPSHFTTTSWWTVAVQALGPHPPAVRRLLERDRCQQPQPWRSHS